MRCYWRCYWPLIVYCLAALLLLLLFGAGILETGDIRAMRAENGVLQKRLTVMQKRLEVVKEGMEQCTAWVKTEGAACNKQVLECEQNTTANIAKHCGSLCSSCYLLVREVAKDIHVALDRGRRTSAEAAP